MKYDYIIVGAGLFGATFAYMAKQNGYKCLVIDKRNHIGGNIYTENIDGITVHKYGAHIFHTNKKETWDFVNQFAEFNNFINSPIAIYKNVAYNLPFNMNTFAKIWNLHTPEEAKIKIEEEKKELMGKEPTNLEEQAINLVGRTIYERLVKGYTEKQWGKKCNELPPSIIKRLPVRFTYNNNYFFDRYQGIPIGGYTQMIGKMLSGIDIKLNYDFFSHKDELLNIGKKIVYTGMIDEYYKYCYGSLEYRSLRFETETLNIPNYQGNAVINYTEAEIPYTRIIEHKFFENNDTENTIITKEYPDAFEVGKEAYYPINNDKNNELYEKYKMLADKETNIIFGGRLGCYKYYDMDKTIETAIDIWKKEK